MSPGPIITASDPVIKIFEYADFLFLSSDKILNLTILAFEEVTFPSDSFLITTFLIPLSDTVKPPRKI